MRQYRRSRLGADKGGTGSADQLGGLQELYEDSGKDLEAKWEHVKQMWIGACERVVGWKTTQHKTWITPVTLEKIQTRKGKKAVLNDSRSRAAKAKAQRECSER